MSGTSGSGAVFFSYCPLHCVYCQNFAIANGDAGTPVSIERLMEIFQELKLQGALNINLVTPTHYAPVLAKAIRASKREGFDLPFVWNTSGYENVEQVRELADAADVYLVDFKYASAEVAQRYSHAANYPQIALGVIGEMLSCAGSPQFDTYGGQRRLTRGVIVRHLLLPGHLEDSMDAIAILRNNFELADEDGAPGLLLSLMNQYTPVLGHDPKLAARFPNLTRKPTDEEYEDLLDFADTLGIPFYYWQQGGAMDESFIPDFDLTGVVRGN